MHVQEWRQLRKRGHLRRLGPWLLVSALCWALLLLGLERVMPEASPPLPTTPITMRSVDAKQWMQNKSIQQKSQPRRIAQKEQPEKNKEEKKKKVIPPKQPKGQIVDIAMPDKQEVPDEAKFVSQYDSKVEKQSKAKIRRPADTVTKKESRSGVPNAQQAIERQEGKLVLNDPRKPHAPGSTNPQNLVLVPDLKMAMKLDLKDDGTRGEFKNRERENQTVKGNSERLQMLFDEHEKGMDGENGVGPRSNIPKSLLPDLNTALEVAGAPMNDRLEDVPEGEETWLNTKSFKYATFYNRVKREVAKRWRPANAQARFDPTHAIHGYQNRYTVVFITLDDKGNLQDAEVSRSSGVGFLDEEALSAVLKAAPFPNPPPGIVESDGKIKFPFGFYFELGRNGRF